MADETTTAESRAKKDEAKTAEKGEAKKAPESQVEDPESWLSRGGIWVVVGMITAAMVVAVVFWNKYGWYLDNAQMIGDASAPIAGAFTVGALVAALIALRLQTEELRLQRRELKASVEALNAQAAEARAANIQNEKALEFERGKARKADERAAERLDLERKNAEAAQARAKEAQSAQIEMANAALAETQMANADQARKVVRDAYADWLGRVDLWFRAMEEYAEWLGRSGRDGGMGGDNDFHYKRRMEMTKSYAEAETLAYIKLRLVDTNGIGVGRASEFRTLMTDVDTTPAKLSLAIRKKRDAVERLADSLAQELL